MQYDESAGRAKDATTTVTTNLPSSSSFGDAELQQQQQQQQQLGKPVQIRIETITRVVPAEEAADVVSPGVGGAAADADLAPGTDLGPHEKTMTEKVKEMLIDTGHFAKEKTLGALHVAYEKLHDAGIVVEDKAAQVLKNMGHAQQVKAEELERDATQKRIEVAEEERIESRDVPNVASSGAAGQNVEDMEVVEHPKSPGILTKAYHKIHDAAIAMEDKAAQVLKNMGHSSQQTAAELEEDAGQKRMETFREDVTKPKEKGILDKAKDLGIAAEEKVASAFKGMGKSNKDAAGSLEQDAGERRMDALAKESEPGLLDKAKEKFQSATAAVEDTTAKALHELSDKGKNKADELQWDASKRKRTPSPGRISPQILDSFGVVSANVEEKAARMREAMGHRELSPIGSSYTGSAFTPSGGSGKKSIEIDVDSVLGGHSFGGSQALSPSSTDYSSATRLPKEVPPPEERKVNPDPVD